MSFVHGGFTAAIINDAKALIGGAKSFSATLHHRPNKPMNEDGSGEEHFVGDLKSEGKDVWMFIGCNDDRASADTSIASAPIGKLILSIPDPCIYSNN